MKICFLGPFSPPISGPGVKNAIMLDWFRNELDEHEIRMFNSNNLRKGNISSVLREFWFFLKARTVILSVSKNGRLLLVPLCVLLNKSVILFPAGGSFHQEINSLPALIRSIYLRLCRSIVATYCQTLNLQKELLALDFKNVYYFPNPRKDRGHSISMDNDEEIKIIFLSKIREGKGPLLLIEAVKQIGLEVPDRRIQIDFYGLIEKDFKQEFLSEINAHSNINYKGRVNPDRVQETIAKYDIFVLPTMFPEGMPGAVIEAMFTSIPIIVSNFTAAHELIEDQVDGIIIPQNDINALIKALMDLIADKGRRENLGKKAKLKSRNFDLDHKMTLLKSDLIRFSKI